MNEQYVSRWQSSVNDLSEGLEKCIQVLVTADTTNHTGEVISEYSRLLKVIKLLQGRLADSDPELISVNFSSNLQGSIDTVNSNIVAFVSSGNIGNLRNANNSLDNIIDQIGLLGKATQRGDIKACADASAEFQNKIVEELMSVRARAADAKQELDGLKSSISQAGARLDENNSVIEQQKSRLDQSIAEYQKQFSDAQEKRTVEFSTAIKNHADELSQQIKDFENRGSEAAAQLKASYDQTIANARIDEEAHTKFLEGRREEVDEIFGAIGTTALAGNYKTTADNESKEANRLRLMALGLMSLMILVGGFAFYYSLSHEPNLILLGVRFGATLIIAVPAFYAASESTKHRERERALRKIHLELAAIDSYLVHLPEEQRNTIKGDLAEKFFGLPLFDQKLEEVTQKDLLKSFETIAVSVAKLK